MLSNQKYSLFDKIVFINLNKTSASRVIIAKEARNSEYPGMSASRMILRISNRAIAFFFKKNSESNSGNIESYENLQACLEHSPFNNLKIFTEISEIVGISEGKQKT